ncbi:MAG: glycosyltransferase family 4 protein [Clostridium sp.]|nr:glycosyltransferase family 4 protein [Prevotella sp.]MCM1429222.1 glycosyltransferase family 4 protein [Clostridium sp.]MCM1475805.1 glycosyltransferase family 4 protein [Muribaculaceae bacterium]
MLKRFRKEENILFWRIPFDTKPSERPVAKTGQLVYAGTIEPRKGLHYLIEAMAELKSKGCDVELKVIGKGVDEAYELELRKNVDSKRLPVEFCGYVSKEEKGRIFAHSDIFVFASVLEGFGMVLVEAQTYGLPIVCFNNSAMPYTVKNGENGFLVPTGDSLAMAKRIEEIVSDRGLRERMSEKALENARSQIREEEFCAIVGHDVLKFGTQNS